MVSWLHLAQFSHLTFEECHSELCGVFGIPRNGIFFHEINFLFRHINKAGGGHFENFSSRYNHLCGDDYLSNRPQVSMVCGLMNDAGCW